MPELWGGSSDLAGSNNTTIKAAPSFVPAARTTDEWKGDPYAGRVLHFGIREHAMGAIMNGIALHGGTRVFGGTFLTFSDYMRGAVRLAALMQLPVTYVWTHDSIGLGEDGPTHQPIEHVAALRAIPGLDIVRPADANEVSAAWQADPGADRPPCRSRPDPSERARSSRAARTASPTPPASVAAATSSSTSTAACPTSSWWPPAPRSSWPSRPAPSWPSRACAPASSPCRAASGSTSRTSAYRDSVIPPTVKARVSVEAGIAQGWREIVGDHGRIVSIETYGASANFERLFEEYGITTEAVVHAAQDSLRVSGD